MIIELDMYQTLAIAVVVLMLGKFLRKKCSLLEKFCIPAPVVGGVLFAVFTCVCYVTGIVEFTFDDILKEVCMVFFFTSVGFQANLKVLKSGGKSMLVFLSLVVALILAQNFLAVGLSNVMRISPLVGLCTGSIPMVGGHGTAGAFGPVLEDFGIKGATTLCTAAATYGLIAGSMMGGPLGKMLIERHHLLDTIVPEDDSLLVEEEIKHERHASMYPSAVFQLIIAIGIGTVVSKLLSLTGMTFPIYIGAMIAAACMRNIGEYTGKITIYMGEINDIGGYYAFSSELKNGGSVYDFDRTKLAVHTLDVGLAGIEVYDILRDEYDIQIEFGDIGNILAYLSIGDRPQEIERLVSALAEIKRRYHTDGTGLLSQEYIDPVVAASPQEAFYAPKKSLPLRETEGMVCSEFVMCYPPGIPILAPGERITKEILNYIEYAKAKGCSMTGPEDPDILHLNVLA